MAGETAVAAAGEDGGAPAKYGDRVTFSVVVTCVMAACCGLTYGYDIGISGGVSQMDSFLESFFPDVVKGLAGARKDVYCKYDNQGLTAFNSSLFLAGVVSAMVGSYVTKAVGRQGIMLIGGSLFLSGVAINAAAVHVAMLIIGRMLLGLGIGFTNQAAPVYLAEVAPARWRGGFTAAFSLCLVVGTVMATLINYGAVNIPRWGWRLSLGLAAVPASLVLLGALLIDDSPSSLVLRGKIDKARRALDRVRGTGSDTDAEFKDIVSAVDEARRHEEGALRRLLRRQYRPQLVMAVAIPFFFQLTGVILLSIYAPVLFRTVGFSSRNAILGSVIISLITLASTVLMSAVVDRVGRRKLFLIGGVVMCASHAATAGVMWAELAPGGRAEMSRGGAAALLVLVCVTTVGYGISWGPLRWVVPGEVFAVEVRSVAQGLSVCVSLTLIFAQTEYFLAMLCAFKAGTFLYYSGWVAVMTVLAVLFMPETKGVPLERMGAVWARHWFWRRFVVDSGEKEVEEAS